MNSRRLLTGITTLLLIVATSTAFSFRSRYERSERLAAGSAANLRAVAHFFSLDTVPLPTDLSPYWLVRATNDFADAPIHIVLYGDPLCADCGLLFEQMKRLEAEFAGKMNVAYQFFPLEARCNDVVAKDKHPGACDLSYMMAAQPGRFRTLHDEILQNMDSAKAESWRARFAARHGVADALTDTMLHRRVHSLIRTGAQYAPTSEKYAHGIRSTPTLIINQRMVIGTLPLAQLRAIFQALVYASEVDERRFMESWINPGCSIESEATQCGTD